MAEWKPRHRRRRGRIDSSMRARWLRFLEVSRRVPGRSRWRVLMWWTGARDVVWAFFKIAYRIRIIGAENVPEYGPIIYVSNHQSHYDPCIVGLVATDR